MIAIYDFVGAVVAGAGVVTGVIVAVVAIEWISRIWDRFMKGYGK